MKLFYQIELTKTKTYAVRIFEDEEHTIVVRNLTKEAADQLMQVLHDVGWFRETDVTIDE